MRSKNFYKSVEITSHFTVFVKVFQFESKNRIIFALENIQIILNINKKNQKKKLPLECSRIYILEYMKTILKHIKINEKKERKKISWRIKWNNLLKQKTMHNVKRGQSFYLKTQRSFLCKMLSSLKHC